MIIPDSLSMATLLPLAAIRPRRVAEPFSWVPIEENVSDCVCVCMFAMISVIVIVETGRGEKFRGSLRR